MDNNKRNLMYLCVFFNKQYLDLLELVAFSLKCYGNKPDNLDLLVFTNAEFKPLAERIFSGFGLDGIVVVRDEIKTKFEACCSRLFVFDWKKIDQYEKILYIDADVLVTGPLNNIFSLPVQNELYGVKEGYIKWRMWGADYFDFEQPDIQKNKSGISSGVLMFLNSAEMKKLFLDIIEHINKELVAHEYRVLGESGGSEGEVNFKVIFGDQPFIVYHGVMSGLLTYDSRRMFKYMAVLNPTGFYKDHVLCHFSGDPGWYDNKMEKMRHYLGSMIEPVGVKDGNIGNVRVVTPSNVADTSEMKYLKHTAGVFGYSLDVIGIGKTFHYLNKIRWLNEYLSKGAGEGTGEEDDDDIIIFTDAYDTFFMERIETIVDEFKKTGYKILWSVEKLYMHHRVDENQALFDQWSLACGFGWCGGYKYINSGGFMGYRKELRDLIQEVGAGLENPSFMYELRGKCKSCRKYCDQQVYGYFLAKQFREMGNKHNVGLDVNCRVFYNASVDANQFDNHVDFSVDGRFHVKEVNGYPGLVHVPWKKKFGPLLDSIYNKTFNEKFFHKTYRFGGYLERGGEGEKKMVFDVDAEVGSVMIDGCLGHYRLGEKWVHITMEGKEKGYRVLFFNQYRNCLMVEVDLWKMFSGEVFSNSDP